MVTQQISKAHQYVVCLASTVDMQNKFKAGRFICLNKDTHSRHISMMQIDPDYGLNFDSPFNELHQFQASIMLPSDPRNCLLEGIVPVELKLILKRLILSVYFNLQKLNAKLVFFQI